MRRFRPECAHVMLCAALCLGLTACGGDPPPEKKTKAPKVVDQGPPPARPVAELIAELGIDDRVWMDDLLAPSTTEQRIAVLTFFDGFARGDADRIRPFLADLEQEELATLDANGQLAQLAREIEGIEIMSGATHDGQPAVLGLYEFAGHIEGQMWEVQGGGVGYVLQAAPLPPGLSHRLGATPFEDWYAAVAAEEQMRDAPDLGVERARAVAAADDPDADVGGGGSSGGGPKGPGGR
ncbi:MAG: hypothetical protein QF561_06585 [Phycisphaerales bacterium]|nr:hypothetical protein [Phycisphaerales bacterium]